jgi:hypothetical protein
MFNGFEFRSNNVNIMISKTLFLEYFYVSLIQCAISYIDSNDFVDYCVVYFHSSSLSKIH